MAPTRARRDVRAAAAPRRGRERAAPRPRARAGPAPRTQAPFSCGKSKVDDVAVLDDVFLALETHLAVVAARRHRTARRERVVADHFRTDEAARNVAVDFARGQLRGGVARNRPRPALVF